MRTKEQYIEGLKTKNPNLYYDGKKIDRLDELQLPAINVMGMTFDAAFDPELKDLCTATSHLTGETISRFTHIHQSVDDLHKKQDMTRALTNKAGGCIQRCMGTDAANAINAVSFEASKNPDRKTDYYANWLKWLEYFQKNDLVASCAQTDQKGERLKRPAEQPDPDMYLHVVSENAEGIIVRGCKVHISEASISDEILVVPNRSLRSDEKEYAISFAIPSDHPQIKQVVSFHNHYTRKVFQKGFMGGYTDSYIIFDDTFVPWERVFLYGETMHGGLAALLFALFHRHSYSGCKPGTVDNMIGMASLAAEINGIDKTQHFRGMLSQLIMTGELGYAAGFTASHLGSTQLYMPGKGLVPYGAGGYIPHSIYANVGRCLTGEAVFHEQEILCDIAGGLPATFPLERDFTNPETKELLEKYLNRNSKMPIEDQIRFWYQFIDYTTTHSAGSRTYGQYHGGGSPIMEEIAITTQYDVNSRKDNVRRLAGMTPGETK